MAKTVAAQLFDKWWHSLLAVPPSSDSPEYDRLRRLWWDQTRVRGKKKTSEFYHPEWENHLTPVLWENFAFLPMRSWFPLFREATKLKELPNDIQEVTWSYAWVGEDSRAKRGFKIVDIVLHYRDPAGVDGIVVVEAKRPGSKITNEKDLDASYYLDIPTLRDFTRRSLLYLSSESLKVQTRQNVRVHSLDVGFLSWEDLAAIQIRTALNVDCPEPFRTVVAAAIHRQFLSYGVLPRHAPPLAYLEKEKSRREIEESWKNGNKPDTGDGMRERWRLPALK